MKKLSFFAVMRSLLAMRFRTLGWSSLVAIALNIIRGTTWGLGVSAMQAMFEAVETTVQNPAVGLSPILTSFMFLGLVLLSDAALNNASQYIVDVENLKVTQDLYDKINRKAQHIDAVAYEDTAQLEMIEKAKNSLRNDAPELTWGFLKIFTFYLPFLIYMGVYLYSFRPLLVLIFGIIALPTVGSLILRSKLLRNIEDVLSPIRREFAHYEQAMTAREFLKETRQTGAHGYFYDRYIQSFKKMNKAIWKYRGTPWFFEIGFRAVAIAVYAAVIALLVFSLRDGFITIGAFAAVLASTERLYDAVANACAEYFTMATEKLVYMRSLIGFLRLPERNGTQEAAENQRHFCLKNVSFTYPGRDEAAIRDVSLNIKPGQTIALVGENGAGKSTLVKLITGIFLPTDGEVLVDGVPTGKLTTSSLFGGVSGVFQRHQKYKFTARENVAISELSRPQDDETIAQAMQHAGADVHAQSFPSGLDTMLSREFEEGVDLSGGQWQRMAIARGLYRTHDFIVLDEPTAAIDPIEETAIYQRFAQLSANKTAILVTHRLGSTKIADFIYVLDQGRIVEQGDHASLLEENGLYASMYRSQMQWYSRG